MHIKDSRIDSGNAFDREKHPKTMQNTATYIPKLSMTRL